MDAIRSLLITSVAAISVIITSVSPAWSKNPVDSRALKLYQGSYSSQCGNPAAPRLRVNAKADALVFEHGKKRITGRNVMAAYSSYGPSSPENFELELMSEVRSDTHLIFAVYRDNRGLYIKLDGDDKMQGALGKKILGYEYRNCAGTAGKLE